MPRPIVPGALRFGVLLLLGLSRASADLLPVGPGDFSGSETVITFDGLTPGEAVAANYVGHGVFFGSACSARSMRTQPPTLPAVRR